LVKTVRYGKHRYIGDTVNTCRIFNELEVDELVFLDFSATVENREPNIELLREISNECFMPLSYGGGIRDVRVAENIFRLGFEKIILNSYPLDHPGIIDELASIFGSQSIVIAIDVRRNIWGRQVLLAQSGRVTKKKQVLDWAREVEDRGAGEILLTSVDREGTWQGFDLDLTAQVAGSVAIPVIANGGGGCVRHIVDAVRQGRASAVALGSMVVFQGKGLGVLVNFPDKEQLGEILG